MIGVFLCEVCLARCVFSRDLIDSSVACVHIVSSRANGYVLAFSCYIFLGAFYLCLGMVVPYGCVPRYSCICYVLTVVSCP